MDNASVNASKKTLVLGGTGKTGARVVERLNRLGVPVRIGSRSAALPFDWLEPATWEPVLQGIQSVYIAFQPDLAVPGAVEAVRRFSETAVQSGVRHLVLLSGRGEHQALECEQVVQEAGVDWTILRASWFNQNFSESYLYEPIVAGYVALPAAATAEPFIDADDIADVAVAALTETGHTGKLYELTGPRLLTFEAAMKEIAEATGRPIRFESISIDAYRATLAEYGVPQEYTALLTYLFTEVMDGRNASLAHGVEQALGRKPIDFAEFVRKTAASGVWSGNAPVSDPANPPAKGLEDQ